MTWGARSSRRLTDVQRTAIRRQLKRRADGAAVIVLWIGLHFMTPTVTWRQVLGVFIIVCAGGLLQWKFEPPEA